MTFGIVTDMMQNRHLAGTGLTVETCKTAIDAAKASCTAAAALGVKDTVYLSTAVIPLAMLCFFLTRFTIKQDVEHSQSTPSTLISLPRLSAYFFAGGALPGYALARASKMFFKHPPAHMDLWGLVIGGLIGIAIAVMIAKSHDPKPA